MAQSLFSSVAEQVAETLREGMLEGRWSDSLPGRDRLAGELGVSGNTVESALRQLQREGWLMSQGPGRRRKIVIPANRKKPSLRVALLLFDKDDRRVDYVIDLQHQLADAGHAAAFAEKTLQDLCMDVRRVARMVGQSSADAWVVLSGSREVLEWFAGQPTPALALAGRRRGLPIAACGPDKPDCFAEVGRRLIALGHRRIVLVTRRERRLPRPGTSEQAFLDELQRQGIAPSRFHLPDWEESPHGFHSCLKALFQSTPPTALFVDESRLFFAAQQFLLHHGIRVPQDVSLVCTDGDPHFAWCTPSVAHIQWDSRPLIRRVVRWAANVSHGRNNRRQSLHKARFVEGGTIGAANGR